MKIAVVALCLAALAALAYAEDAPKLIKPTILNPLEDPNKAAQLAKIASVMANEPKVAQSNPPPPPSDNDNSGYPTPEDELKAARDDMKLLADLPCKKKGCKAALKAAKKEKKLKKEAKKAAKGAFVEITSAPLKSVKAPTAHDLKLDMGDDSLLDKAAQGKTQEKQEQAQPETTQDNVDLASADSDDGTSDLASAQDDGTSDLASAQDAQTDAASADTDADASLAKDQKEFQQLLNQGSTDQTTDSNNIPSSDDSDALSKPTEPTADHHLAMNDDSDALLEIAPLMSNDHPHSDDSDALIQDE